MSISISGSTDSYIRSNRLVSLPGNYNAHSFSELCQARKVTRRKPVKALSSTIVQQFIVKRIKDAQAVFYMDICTACPGCIQQTVGKPHALPPAEVHVFWQV